MGKVMGYPHHLPGDKDEVYLLEGIGHFFSLDEELLQLGCFGLERALPLLKQEHAIGEDLYSLETE